MLHFIFVQVVQTHRITKNNENNDKLIKPSEKCSMVMLA